MQLAHQGLHQDQTKPVSDLARRHSRTIVRDDNLQRSWLRLLTDDRDARGFAWAGPVLDCIGHQLIDDEAERHRLGQGQEDGRTIQRDC